MNLKMKVVAKHNAAQSMNDIQKCLVLFSNEVMKPRALDKGLIFVPQLNSGNMNTNAIGQNSGHFNDGTQNFIGRPSKCKRFHVFGSGSTSQKNLPQQEV